MLSTMPSIKILKNIKIIKLACSTSWHDTNRYAPLGRDTLGTYRMDSDVCTSQTDVWCLYCLCFETPW